MSLQFDNVTNQLRVVDSVAANASASFSAQGTGAINFAPGSSGLNLSNGGTVTAITRTAAGSNYTSVPSVAISAPTTAGGVQATASCTLTGIILAVAGGGTGYTAGDILTFVGGTGTAQQITVASVSGGVITGVNGFQAGAYSVVPSNPISVTGGTGSGATINVTSWGVNATLTITNAGSGYVEQPTVTFSGGGGSGAAAYATVGSGTTLRSLGTLFDVVTAAGTQARFGAATGGVVNGLVAIQGDQFSRGIITGVNTLVLSSTGTNNVDIQTNSTAQVQMRIAHTASAVNFVQVTGAATGSFPTISAQGSDANAGLSYVSKGNQAHYFFTRGGGTQRLAFVINDSGAASVNYLQAQANISGAAPVLSALGSDTNIGLNLTTKGTGALSVNTGSGEQVRITDATTSGKYTLFSRDNGSNVQLIGAPNSANIGIYSTAGGSVRFYTESGLTQEQLRVSPTTSAVNYVQVTGAATGLRPTISAQGSDTNVGLTLGLRGTGPLVVLTDGSTFTGFVVQPRATNGDTWIETQRNVGFVDLIAASGVTDSDIRFTPKGAGRVRFGTLTASSDVPITGYIEIKDAGGTIRRLAVVA